LQGIFSKQKFPSFTYDSLGKNHRSCDIRKSR
jgi:hypothetical protein